MPKVKIASEEKIKELNHEIKRLKMELAEKKAYNKKLIQNGEESYLNSSTYFQMQEYIKFLENSNKSFEESIKNIRTKTEITNAEWTRLHAENQEFCENKINSDYWIGIADNIYDAKAKKKSEEKIISLESQINAQVEQIKQRDAEIERLRKLVGELKETTTTTLPLKQSFDPDYDKYKKKIEEIKEIEQRVEIMRQIKHESMKTDGRGRPRLNDSKIEMVMTLRKQGLSVREIAKELNVGVATVHKYMKEGQNEGQEN